MKIADLWFTQRKLKRFSQIPEMVENLLAGEVLEKKIVLQECDDGEIEIVNGHHRVTAMWLAGFDSLRYGDYVCLATDRRLRRVGRVKEMTSIMTNGRSPV